MLDRYTHRGQSTSVYRLGGVLAYLDVKSQSRYQDPMRVPIVIDTVPSLCSSSLSCDIRIGECNMLMTISILVHFDQVKDGHILEAASDCWLFCSRITPSILRAAGATSWFRRHQWLNHVIEKHGLVRVRHAPQRDY